MIACPDGDHYLIDWKELAIQYNTTSFAATLKGLGLLAGELEVTPQQLQQVTETTQQWDEYLKGLVAGYNAYAITSEQYRDGITRIIPRLKQNAADLENDRKELSQGKNVDRTRIQDSLHEYSAGLGRLVALSRVLTPAHEMDPPIPRSCGKVPPPNALKVFLGDSLAWTTRDKFVILKVADQNLVSVGRNADGRLLVYARVFSSDGKIIAEIENNRFHVNPNNYFKLERPDSHTLAVHDLKGERVLALRYVNARTVKLAGEFMVSGHPLLSVGEGGLNYGPLVQRGACLYNIMGAAFEFR